MQVLLEQARAEYPGSPRTPDDTWWLPASMGGTAPTLEQATERDDEDRAQRAARRAAKQAGDDGTAAAS
jgi:hypothetical protein